MTSKDGHPKKIEFRVWSTFKDKIRELLISTQGIEAHGYERHTPGNSVFKDHFYDILYVMLILYIEFLIKMIFIYQVGWARMCDFIYQI